MSPADFMPFVKPSKKKVKKQSVEEMKQALYAIAKEFKGNVKVKTKNAT